MDFEPMGLFGHHRYPLQRLERNDLRQHIANRVIARIPEAATILLPQNGEMFAALEDQVAAYKAQAPAGVGQPGHPIQTWLVTHAPQIEAFVIAVLKMFGINVPPLPPLPFGPPSPPVPTPPPVVPPVVGPTPPAPVVPPSPAPPFTPSVSLPASGAGDYCGTSEAVGFAFPTLPPFLQQLILNWMLSTMQKALPEITAKLPEWEAYLEAQIKKAFGG